ncbi:MAG: transcriptional regulator [Pseudomonadota bacterium]
MDRRQLAATFRDRLRSLVERHPGGVARFAREVGLDRSGLIQFLDAESTRLPRAETLRTIAEGCGSSVDWLLGLTEIQLGGQEIAPSVEIETAFGEGGPEGEDSPLARWRREAEGAKIRYVPSSLPDMFRLRALQDTAIAPDQAEVRAEHGDALVDDARLRDTDLEICMGVQVLEGLAAGEGLWAEHSAAIRAEQLRHIARETERLYPAIRLHLFDQRRTFSAPFTVFALKRAAIYLGQSYLVVTASEQVRDLARHFDALVRAATVPPHRVHETLEGLARQVR